VNDDVKREQIRTDQEKDMWHAVGHEILAPLQSLMALHARSDDPSRRYIERMQQAVRVLYGAASPSEAIESASLQMQTLDINSFLTNVAMNAAHAGIDGVTFAGVGSAVVVRADEHSLEDVITHVLANADRYRAPGTPIRVTLAANDQSAEVNVYNDGPSIPDDRLEKIFEYGVSDTALADSGGHRGQGLFVARTYMAKMGGTVIARNVPDGVEFVLTLARA
jgi:signal transduction histidine kinase